MGGHGSGRRTRYNRSRINKVELDMERNLDLLAEFQKFKDEIAPILQEDLRANLSAQDLYTKYQAMAAARGISIALTETDSAKALAAIRDIQDRAGGKATERKEVTHKHEKLPDDQLDALLMSKFEDNDTDDDTDLQ